MKRVLVVAPHPDDETLGCGGTLLRHRAGGDELHWIVVTSMTRKTGYSAARIKSRASEIKEVSRRYGFTTTQELGFATTTLDTVPTAELVASLSRAFRRVEPNIVLLPFPGDPHSDHKIAFSAAAACTKSFRFPSIRRVLCYEALSETDFGLDPARAFTPNVFVDITEHLDAKIDTMRVYTSELGKHPFPRSEASLRALATMRGAAAGFPAAEAFMLLRETL